MQISKKNPVYLIVRNLDVLAIDHPTIFNVICHLAQIPWVYLLATSDNFNIGLGELSKYLVTYFI